MAVMMQAFFWDCPKIDEQEHNWWNHVASKVEDLGKAGINSLWLPPVSKAASNTSMGYDPYDYFDLGEFDQKGGVKTWYGSLDELKDSLFRLELRRQAGTISEEDYARERERIDATLRNLVRG